MRFSGYVAVNELNWNRLVDRDMVMRYHWGAGVGHIYTHHNQGPFDSSSQTRAQSQSPASEELEDNSNANTQAPNASEDTLPASGSTQNHKSSNDSDGSVHESDGGSRSGSESSDPGEISGNESEEEGWEETYGPQEDFRNPDGSFSYD